MNSTPAAIPERYRQAQMTFRTTIIILSIAGLLYSCNNTKRGDKELEEQANHIIQRLDTSTLQFLELLSASITSQGLYISESKPCMPERTT